MRTSRTSAYQEMMINSKFLEVPRGSYQRELNIHRVRKIAAAFDPRLLNPPKVSYRSGRYYVFDGQHTIAVLKLLNGGKDLMVRCIVYTGMTESEEALLFAQQTGESARLTPGDKIRAMIYGGDPECMAFLKATESVGVEAGLCSAPRKVSSWLHRHCIRGVQAGGSRPLQGSPIYDRGRLAAEPTASGG